ncbi:MAG: D-aminopeptidase [Pseudorhodobacter sp.]|nr:D-aminopeptidase [Pseudorhodobacter sp.]
MASIDKTALERAIEELPRRFPGPGGVVGVVKDGVMIERHAWGFANLESHQPFSNTTQMPICSITKQFTCATLLSVSADPSALDPLTAALLPRLEGGTPSTADLANSQSGLRDYWALTVLCGAMPEGDFRPTDAVTLLGLTRSLHFKPGTAYSYSNGNFRLLALALEQHTGAAFGDLMMARVVGPAGLPTASFVAETGALPGGATGYEGTSDTGWRSGINRLHWSGDAGLCMSIDDLIAWECYIDRTRDDAGGLYNRLSAPVTFADGSPASYGRGLVRRNSWGRQMSGHGGAIRGWRLQRFVVPGERLSVAIAFNHESDAHAAAMHVLAAALGESAAPAPSDPASAKRYLGTWLDRRWGLLLDVTLNPDGTLAATYDGGAEELSLGADSIARGLDMTLSPTTWGLRIQRPADAIDSEAEPLGAAASGPATDIAGRYHSDELEADLEIVNAGGAWFASFHGFLGTGPLMPVTPVGADVWRLACHRALDAPAPGDWTVRVQHCADGKIASVTVGCWLARNVTFRSARM